MIFVYRKRDGVVVARCEKEDSFQKDDKILSEFSYEPTKEELDMIEQNYPLQIKDGDLVFTKPPTIAMMEEKQVLIDKLQSKEVTAEDVGNILLKLL